MSPGETVGISAFLENIPGLNLSYKYADPALPPTTAEVCVLFTLNRSL